MVLDRFKTKEEIEKEISNWWNDLEYLDKICVLLRACPGYSITKIEARGIGKLWNGISLEKKEELYSNNWRYK